jgi:predicted nucleic acid-binding Zn ribbon protein
MTNNHNTQSIKDLMLQVLKKNKLEAGMQQLDVTDAWKQVMGNGVWTYTSSIKLNNSKLTVCLKSSALREELSYGKDKIVAMLNEQLGVTIVKKIILL